MILQSEDKLYDLKLYFYDKLMFKEKYYVNVLDWYKSYGSPNMNIIIYDEEFEEIKTIKCEHCIILNNYVRDDILLVSRNPEYVKFKIITGGEERVL